MLARKKPIGMSSVGLASNADRCVMAQQAIVCGPGESSIQVARIDSLIRETRRSPAEVVQIACRAGQGCHCA
jgi:hypothetical protein